MLAALSEAACDPTAAALAWVLATLRAMGSPVTLYRPAADGSQTAIMVLWPAWSCVETACRAADIEPDDAVLAVLTAAWRIVLDEVLGGG